MKFTGIVRKLDMLGRIVIPREYRKMHKIKATDPLEIIAMENGDILIRKVDLSAELTDAGAPILEEVYNTLGRGVMLADGEKYLAGAGAVKNRLIGSALSRQAQSLIEERKCYNGAASGVGLEGAEHVSLCPIFGEDVFGALVLFSDQPVEAWDGRVLQLAGRILGNSMQRF